MLKKVDSNEVMELLLKVVGSGCPKEEDGDYRDKEGLLVCHVCGERKEAKINLHSFGERVHPTACKCTRAIIEIAREQEKIEKEKRIVSETFRYSLVDTNFWKSTFDAYKVTKDNEKQFTIAKNYVEHFDEMFDMNKGLLFHGNPSTGKTYLAYCIANELLKKRVPLIVTSILKLTSASGPFSREAEEIGEIVSRMNNAKLLVIDDLGAERESDFRMEQVFGVINARYEAKKPFIITTNIPLSAMQKETSIKKMRVYERIFAVCHPVQCFGKSWRREQAENDYDKVNKILLGEYEV